MNQRHLFQLLTGQSWASSMAYDWGPFTSQDAPAGYRLVGSRPLNFKRDRMTRGASVHDQWAMGWRSGNSLSLIRWEDIGHRTLQPGEDQFELLHGDALLVVLQSE